MKLAVRPLFAIAFCLLVSGTMVESARARTANSLTKPMTVDDFLTLADRTLDRYHFTMDTPTRAQRALEDGKRLARGAETITQLWLLLYIQTVNEESRLAPVNQGPRPTKTQLLEVTAQAFVNHFNLYSGLLCGELAGCAIDRPLRKLEIVLKEANVRSSVAVTFSNLARSAGVLGAFMAGSSLIDQSRYGLTEADQKIAATLPLGRVLLGRGTADQARVAGEIVRNALSILTFYQQPENSREWVYNTLRRNANGETVTSLLGFSLGAAALGAAVGTPTIPIPFVGTLIGWSAGFVGGLGGGLLAYNLPTAWKDRVSDGIYAARDRLSRRELNKNEAFLRSYIRLLQQPSLNEDLYAQGFAQYLELRTSVLNEVVTSYMERINLAYQRWGQAQDVLGKVQAEPNIPFIKDKAMGKYVDGPQSQVIAPEDLTPSGQVNSEFTRQRDYNQNLFDDTFASLMDVEINEMELLQDIFLSSGTDLPDRVAQAIQDRIKSEQKLLEVFQQMNSVLIPGRVDSSSLQGLDQSQILQVNLKSQALLNLYDLRGFRREKILP